MSEPVQLSLTEDEALVTFEWLSGFGSDHLGRAEKAAVDSLLAQLEKQLTAPFAPDYLGLLRAARARLGVDD